MINYKFIKRSKAFLKYLFLFIIAVIMFFPIYWMVACSLMTAKEVILIPPHLYPHFPTFNNFLLLLSHSNFMRYLFNSIIIVTISTFISVFTSVIGGYILGKFEFRGKNVMFLIVLATTMIPFQTYMVPFYLMTQKLGLINTYTGIMLPLFITSFGIFFIKQNVISIPNEYMDAARIDGSGEWYLLLKLIIPMIKSSISALTVFQFLFGWKFFIWPLIVTDSAKKFTLEIGLQIFASQNPLDYQLQMAGAVIGMIPIVTVFLLFRKQFIGGVALTGIK
ncbi:MAG: carbohydrate ABC transporter permease [Sphaerochaeta sp.]